MDNKNNIVDIQNLKFIYQRSEEDKFTAIDDFSLEVDEGDFVAILGQNGSGKSTLAKNINGLYIPSEGDVLVKGLTTKDEANIWQIRQVAGMVFQNPDNQLVSSIVEDDIAFGPENLGVPPLEIRKRVDDALQAVGMYELRKKAPHQLSGGQKQRVAIAGVIAMLPECIIFDEPTAMLDPEGKAEIMSIIKELNNNGKTVILITHFMDEACEAKKIVIMENGKLVKQGTPVEIFSDIEPLLELGLDVPPAVEFACELRKHGIDVPKDLIYTEEIVDYICQYISKI